MARKGKVDIVRNYNQWSSQDNINYSRNISRWNPALAIEWMEQLANRIESPVIIAEYNKGVRQINATIDSIMSQRYYVKDTYWGKSVNPNQRLEEMDEEMDIETYLGIMEMQRLSMQ